MRFVFLVLNKFVVDIRPGVGVWDELSPTAGVSYGEESGRLSKKVVGQVATIKSGQGVTALPYSRETSIIITGQMSGAIYVLPVKVN